MQKGQFKNNGSLYCRGELAFNYKQGEHIELYNKLDESTIQVLILEGEAKGKLVCLNKDKIKFNKPMEVIPCQR